LEKLPSVLGNIVVNGSNREKIAAARVLVSMQKSNADSRSMMESLLRFWQQQMDEIDQQIRSIIQDCEERSQQIEILNSLPGSRARHNWHPARRTVGNRKTQSRPNFQTRRSRTDSLGTVV